jgi:hypothetical protein
VRDLAGRLNAAATRTTLVKIFTGGAFKTSAIFVMHRMGATLRVDARSRAAFAAFSPQAAYQQEDSKKGKGYFE